MRNRYNTCYAYIIKTRVCEDREREGSVVSLSKGYLWANLLTVDKNAIVTKNKGRDSYPLARRNSIFVNTSAK